MKVRISFKCLRRNIYLQATATVENLEQLTSYLKEMNDGGYKDVGIFPDDVELYKKWIEEHAKVQKAQ